MWSDFLKIYIVSIFDKMAQLGDNFLNKKINVEDGLNGSDVKRTLNNHEGKENNDSNIMEGNSGEKTPVQNGSRNGNNSIFNTISKIVNRSTKVIIFTWYFILFIVFKLL